MDSCSFILKKKNSINNSIFYSVVMMVWFGLWCLMQLSTIFQLYRGGDRSTQRKPPTCRKSLYKLYHIILDQVHLAMNGYPTHNFSDDRH
jgi:hypothetical protein